jgi:hypothetical protein
VKTEKCQTIVQHILKKNKSNKYLMKNKMPCGMRSGLTRLISSGKRAFMLKLKKEHLKYRIRTDSVANLTKIRPKTEKG